MAGGNYGPRNSEGEHVVVEIDPNRSLWGDVKNAGMWIVDNGLYNTKEPWNSWENLFNIGTLGVSVVAGAFTAGTGTAAVLGARMSLGTAAKAVAKGALTAGAKEVVITTPVVAGLSAGVDAANDFLGDDEETENNADATLTPDAPQTDTTTENSAEEPAAESPALSLAKSFNESVDSWDSILPHNFAVVAAALSTLSEAMTKMLSGELDFNDMSELASSFMSAMSGETTDIAAPAGERSAPAPDRGFVPA